MSGWTPLPERRTVATETKNTAPPETATLKGQNWQSYITWCTRSVPYSLYFCTMLCVKLRRKAWRYRLLIWNFNGISPCTLSDLCLDAEKQRSLCLVRVPLNVEHTLSSYQRAFERGRQCLLLFQRSHSLLLRLLADTQPCEWRSADGADADVNSELRLGVSLQALQHSCTTLIPDARLNST